MKSFIIILTSMIVLSCTKDDPTFREDLKLLERHSKVRILSNEQSYLVISPEWQGRVFTSSANGMDGKSLGYFNRNALKKGTPSQNLSKLGGESRFWFGPEIGDYSIFFEQTEPQAANNIVISPELNTRHFSILKQTEQSITAGGEMLIRNASGYQFKLYVERKITLLNQTLIEKMLNVKIPKEVAFVGFSANTIITNKNAEQWNMNKGLLSIWELSCIPPTPKTTVIIPTQKPIKKPTIYFTNLDETRVKTTNEAVYYKADANYMNKIGIQPEYCKNIFGSFSPESNMLTIVAYKFNHEDTLYVNSLWGHTHPYKGDVINVFNGEVNKKEQRNWPFYEMETSSAVKELKPNEKFGHQHAVFHFIGNEKGLELLSEKLLGVNLQTL